MTQPVSFNGTSLPADIKAPALLKWVLQLGLHDRLLQTSWCRFKYSHSFLKWALQPPGFKPEWHLGVRVASNRKLVGFITAVPASIRAKHNTVAMVEINFLCVHKKLRSKRLAPVLIKVGLDIICAEGFVRLLLAAQRLLLPPMALQSWAGLHLPSLGCLNKELSHCTRRYSGQGSALCGIAKATATTRAQQLAGARTAMQRARSWCAFQAGHPREGL